MTLSLDKILRAHDTAIGDLQSRPPMTEEQFQALTRLMSAAALLATANPGPNIRQLYNARLSEAHALLVTPPVKEPGNGAEWEAATPAEIGKG